MFKKIHSPGTLSAIFAYFLWGIVPIYWKQLHSVAPLEILAHRTLWAFAFYLFIGIKQNTSKEILSSIFNTKTLFISLTCSVMLAINWGLFIYAVNSNQILEASLGYFLNPLLNILVGILFFKEKTNVFTKYGFFFAALGTSVLSFGLGKIPWIAIALALSFSLYGVLRKKQKGSVWLSSLSETFYLAPISILYLIFSDRAMALLSYPGQDIALLIFSGVVTGLPLLFFAYAAQEMPFSKLGFYQYISPILQLTTGVLIYNEPTSIHHKISFLLVWLALVITALGPQWRKNLVNSPS